jgi:hypothetical protein
MNTALKSAVARFKAAPRSVKALCYSLLAYLLYAVLLGVITPAVIKSQAPKQLSEKLGRTVQLGEVRINPFLLRFELNGFSIAEQDGSTPFTSVKQIGFQLEFWQSLSSLTPTVKYLHIYQPSVSIARHSDTRFNFTDILETLTAQAQDKSASDTTPKSEPSPIPALVVSDIRVEQGRFDFSDSLTGADLQYDALNVSLQQLNTRAFTLLLPELRKEVKSTPVLDELANRYAVSLSGADNSTLALSGRFQLQPLALKGDLALDDLALVRFWPFAKTLIPASLADGRISFASNYQLEQTGEQLSYQTDNGQFTMTGLRFDHQKQAKVKLKKLTVSDIAVDGNKQAVNISNIDLAGLWADAALSDNGLDLQPLFTPADNGSAGDAEQGSAKQPADTPSWLVNLESFALSADLNLKESIASEGVHWRIHPLNFATGSLTSKLDTPVDYKLALDIGSDNKQVPNNTNGHFSSTGRLDAQQQQIDAELTLSKLDLRQFQTYLTPYLNIDLRQGSLSARGKLSANSQGSAQFNGQASLDNLHINDSLKDEALLKWQSMALSAIDFNLKQQSLQIDKILFDAPYAKVLIAEDKRTNIGEIVVQNDTEPEPEQDTGETADTPETETKKPAPASEPGFALSIDTIEIKNGSAYFADYSLTPSFASGIESLQGLISKISSQPGTTASIDLKGKVDKYAPLTLQGDVNPLVDPPYLDLAFSLSNAELTSVNPYSGTYVGRYIDKGQLSLDIHYQLENNQLLGSNHVLVDQLKLGKKSDSELATDLPVSLAIALLQDRNGVIDLGVDVSGDVNSPDFSVGAIVLKAFANIITKAVTAPFSLLANLVGSDEELNVIQFEPGATKLTQAEKKRLDKLADALITRPKLSLSVEGAVIASQDSSALTEKQLHQKLLKLSGLTSLPEALSASRMPTTGPVSTALQTLFTQEIKQTVQAEQARVEQMLAEEAAGKESDAKTVTLDPEQVATVLHIGMYNQLLKAQLVSTDDLGTLAETRAREVKGYLVEQASIPAERVFVLNSKSDLKTDQGVALLTLEAN